jgi:hypothetical protein
MQKAAPLQVALPFLRDQWHLAPRAERCPSLAVLVDKVGQSAYVVGSLPLEQVGRLLLLQGRVTWVLAEQ